MSPISTISPDQESAQTSSFANALNDCDGNCIVPKVTVTGRTTEDTLQIVELQKTA
jgi:hypothetical protein